MVNIVLILLAINLFSFVVFVFRRYFDNIAFFSELIMVMAIGGSFGAFLAMRIKKTGGSRDGAFKIAIPISMIIQAIVIVYLLLYDLEIVK